MVFKCYQLGLEIYLYSGGDRVLLLCAYLVSGLVLLLLAMKIYIRGKIHRRRFSGTKKKSSKNKHRKRKKRMTFRETPNVLSKKQNREIQ